MYVQYSTLCMYSTVHYVCTVQYTMYVQYSTLCMYSTVHYVCTVQYTMYVQYSTLCMYSTVHYVCTVQCTMYVQYSTLCMCLSPCMSAGERDVFDKLFEEAPQKLEAVKKVRPLVVTGSSVPHF